MPYFPAWLCLFIPVVQSSPSAFLLHSALFISRYHSDRGWTREDETKVKEASLQKTKSS